MPVKRQDAIDRLKGGETLIHVLPRGDRSDDVPIQYLSGGGRVTRATYDAIKPSLQPLSSGLFPDAEPQEWGWSGE